MGFQNSNPVIVNLPVLDFRYFELYMAISSFASQPNVNYLAFVMSILYSRDHWNLIGKDKVWYVWDTLPFSVSIYNFGTALSFSKNFALDYSG